ncbi:MAG: HNH endonuclease [Acidimicrobiales bacterium]
MASSPPDAPGDGGPVGRALNRRERLAAILERDGGCCIWCGRALQVGLVQATTEHLVPRVKGGPSWLENEVAACRRCNGGRGHRTPAEWLAECRGRGWQPDAVLLVRRLEMLERAIGERGGQRRARPYIESQLRRLRRMVEPAGER